MKEHKNIPTCVGFIMDGNRRWAKERNLDTLEGHRKGHETLKDVIGWAKELGVKHIVCYAFSTENWNRTEKEVSYLMNLFRRAMAEIEEDQKGRNTNVRFIGQRERFDTDIQEHMNRLESEAHENPDLTVWLALSYGGRAEIAEAVNKAIEKGEKVTEESFNDLLWTNGMPDPDLIVRTSGEQRISNFLPWQSVYSEFYFSDTYWPAFTKEELKKILSEYGERKRRKGR